MECWQNNANSDLMLKFKFFSLFYIKIKLCLFNEGEERCKGGKEEEGTYIYIYSRDSDAKS